MSRRPPLIEIQLIFSISIFRVIFVKFTRDGSGITGAWWGDPRVTRNPTRLGESKFCAKILLKIEFFEQRQKRRHFQFIENPVFSGKNEKQWKLIEFLVKYNTGTYAYKNVREISKIVFCPFETQNFWLHPKTAGFFKFFCFTFFLFY